MYKKLILPALVAVLLALPAALPAQGATTTCADGTKSTATGKGACSGHGGVKKDGDKGEKNKTTKDAGKNDADEQKGSGAGEAKGSEDHDKSEKQVKCGDGSMSAGGKGACSHHGGVAKGKEGDDSHAKSAATGTSASTGKGESHENAGKGDKGESSKAEGATAKCKDGSYSHSKQHNGACSKHGGVDTWLDGSK